MTALYVIPFMRKLADYIYSLFEPGSTVLAKWLPVFFVPSLVTLPLAPMPGSSIEILKVLGVIIGGFYFTLFSTAFTVLGVKKIKGNGAARSSEQDLELTRQVIMSHISDGTTATGSSKPTKPFSDGFFYTISTSAIMSIVASIVASNKIQNTIITTPLHSAAMLLTTLSSFVFGTRLPKSFTKFFHPLLTCTGITWSVMKMIGMLTNTSFNQLLQSYKVGTLCPVHLGAGDVLLFMLGPAVISLACQMYNRKKLMRDNILETMFGTIMSSAGGLFGTAYLVKYLKLSSDIMRTSLMSRNITAAMALAIANMLNASPSLAVSAVVITGLFGANFGASILDSVGMKDPVARGMGIGAAAHGLGTAAFTEEKDAFPFAAISMALTACASTVLVSIPSVKSALLKIALG
jgi:putative effector of murein hydrolase